MKPILLLLLATLALCHVEASHMVLGDLKGDLAHSEVISYNAIPFKKRVKYFFYSQPDNRNIVGIQALDNLHSKASMNITAGGVGYSYVNLRMKSDRGRGLEYAVGIYVKPFSY